MIQEQNLDPDPEIVGGGDLVPMNLELPNLIEIVADREKTIIIIEIEIIEIIVSDIKIAQWREKNPPAIVNVSI